ncbi:MAG: hypothetical protein MSS95_05460, partial [Bacteroidales bacterium]|nr:hypothetical protein [Bacteroidales bacterium]
VFLVDINPDVDVLSFESFFVSLHCWNGFGGSYNYFSKLPKISFQHFFIMNNTPGNAQRQGAEPRRASTLNAISNPKPHFLCKHSNFWFIFGLVFCQPLLIRNQKNRPFGLFISPLKPIAPV